MGFENGSNFVVEMVYRPPGGDFLDSFLDLVQEKFAGVENVILGRDLNDQFERQDVTSTYFKRVLLENLLELVSSGPTFKRPIVPSWLDVVLLDSSSKVTLVDTLGVPFLADNDYT